VIIPQNRPHIRSFVLRQGRVSTAQRRAVDMLLPQFGIMYRPALLDLDATFGRAAPKILEIGFGMGETTAQIALAQPQNDYLGIEVHTPGVGSLLRLIEAHALSNVRIVQHDAVEVLNHMIAPESLNAIHVFFPDPWPKQRHHKRRLIQPPLVRLLVSRLRVGGQVHLATDWEDYALQMLEVLSGEAQLANTTEGFAARPDYRPLTRFETRGLKLGHRVWDLVFRRNPAAGREDYQVSAGVR
jgi:tRNA (guanine-N7-)-methyltransferase